MKKMLGLLLSLSVMLAFLPSSARTSAATAQDDMRAVWVATVYNIDFPSSASIGNVAAQKAEIDSKMEQFKAAGLNTVILQVRAKNDALYQSALNPWSEALTGTQGEDPGYDPLAYAIESAHSNGLALHAWLNPYRVTTSGTDVSVLSDDNAAKQHPDWVLSYNDALFLNPALPEVQDFIAETVKELLVNYAVDGIHFDDYFYPSGYPLTSGDGDGAQANARREQVNTLIEKVCAVVGQYGNGVVFGVSPQGIYQNVPGSFSGGQSYYSVYADVLAWIDNEWVDYITPQVYWETTHATAPYEAVVSWWNSQVEGKQVKLYIGEAIYKDAVASELTTHLAICGKYANVKGNFYYNATELLANRQGVLDAMKTAYSTAAAQQPVSATPVDVTPTQSTILVDGKAVAFDAYTIHGYNYFKLRDLACAINGTAKQFNTVWDGDTQTILLELGTAYQIVGGELVISGDGVSKTATPSAAKLTLGGTLISCEAYTIGGNNYYKLRDIAQVIDFGVAWSGTINTIDITTGAVYAGE